MTTTAPTNTITTFPDEHALAMEALKIAQGFAAAGTTEQGANRGAQVEKFQAATGGEVGESWCLDFQMFCELKALANLLHRSYTSDTIVVVCQSLRPTLRHYHAVTGSTGEMMRDAQKRNRWLDRSHVTEIRPGDLILYAWSESALNNRVPAHVGRCVTEWRKSAGGKVNSCEGNTGSGDAGSQSDGDGVFIRERDFSHAVGIVKMFP